MRALVQRVTQASVSVQDQVISAIGQGLVVFLGVGRGDAQDDVTYLVDKIANLRIFPDIKGRFSVSARDANAELLVVSQFTLYADTRKGRRPSFVDAALPEDAEPLIQRAVDLFRNKGFKVETGRFGEHMMVTLVNNGPVTIFMDSAERNRPRRG